MLYRIKITGLRESAKTKPTGWLETTLALGKIHAGFLYIDRAAALQIYGEKKFRTLVPRKSAIANRPLAIENPHEWPLWAKALKLIAKPSDKGIGDVIARTIGPAKSAAFKKWYKKTIGKTCGCEKRQSEWNQKFPL